MNELLQVVTSAKPGFGIGGWALDRDRKVLLKWFGNLVRSVASICCRPW